MRLIDADAVANHLKERLIETALNNVGIMASADDVYREMAKNRIDAWLNEMPTVDAVEVIHCEKCKWRHTDGMPIGDKHLCDKLCDYVKPNFYCKLAERRQDEAH